MVAYLFEAGPAVAGEALTHGELRNWQECTGVELSEFEAVALVSMSREYLAMYRTACEDTAAPPPYRREKTEDEKRERARQMRQNRKKNA